MILAVMHPSCFLLFWSDFLKASFYSKHLFDRKYTIQKSVQNIKGTRPINTLGLGGDALNSRLEDTLSKKDDSKL